MPASCAEFEEKAHRTSWKSNCPAVPAIPLQGPTLQRVAAHESSLIMGPTLFAVNLGEENGAASRRAVALTRLRTMPALCSHMSRVRITLKELP